MKKIILILGCIVVLTCAGCSTTTNNDTLGDNLNLKTQTTSVELEREDTSVEATTTKPTEVPTTVEPTTEVPTTVEPTTEVPTTVALTTEIPTEKAKKEKVENTYDIFNDNNVLVDSPISYTNGKIDKEESLSREIFEQLNEYRKANGLKELKWSTTLVRAAETRAKEITMTWAHTRADGSRCYTVCPDVMTGENLAKGYYTASDVTTAWIGSSTHRENMLRTRFTHVGIACYYGENGIFIAEEFGDLS